MDMLIVAIVVVVALAAHVALYRWVRHKIHEGAILNYLRNLPTSESLASRSTEAIAAGTGLPAKRVTGICQRSPDIAADSTDTERWHLC